MKIFTSKNFKQKLIISLVCVILISFCITPRVSAKSSFGGKIMGLMRDFVTAIADVGASVVQLGMTGRWTYAVDKEGTGIPDDGSKYWAKKVKYPILQISPELIFANEIELLDANFITPASKEHYTLELEDKGPLEALRRIIAGWYVTLRTIAVVGLLSVLIYIGIRIMIGSTAADKAKYKQRLVDWVVAFCLLFFMHYIMAAAVTVVDKVNEMLNETSGITKGLDLIPEYGGVKYDKSAGDNSVPEGDLGMTQYTRRNRAKKYIEMISGGSITSSGSWSRGTVSGNSGTLVSEIQITANGKNYTVKETEVTAGPYSGTTLTYEYKEGNGEYVDITSVIENDELFEENNNNNNNNVSNLEGIKTINRDGQQIRYIDGDQILYFTNYARLYLNVADNDEYIPMSVAYLIIYIALVSFTVVFALRYIKRVIYIAWLTLMAPMVALTYPLDKIKDRKSTSLEYVV